MAGPKTLQQRFLGGDEIASLRLPMSCTRDQIRFVAAELAGRHVRIL